MLLILGRDNHITQHIHIVGFTVIGVNLLPLRLIIIFTAEVLHILDRFFREARRIHSHAHINVLTVFRIHQYILRIVSALGVTGHIYVMTIGPIFAHNIIKEIQRFRLNI